MPLDPTERNVYTFLFQTSIRTVNKLVLSLTHDEDITKVKPARACFTVRTRLALPLEARTGTKAHRHTELRRATLSKQRLIVALPSHTRMPSLVKVQVSSGWHVSSAHHGFIGSAMALHNPKNSGQHRPPLCGPTAAPRPYE